MPTNRSTRSMKANGLNGNEITARILVIVTLSGLENFFLEVGREVVEGETEPVAPTPDEIQKLVQTA